MDMRSNSSEPYRFDPNNEAAWDKIYHLLEDQVRYWVCSSDVSVWRGQEGDIIAGVVQEAMSHIVEYFSEYSSWAKEQADVLYNALKRISIVIAYKQYRILRQGQNSIEGINGNQELTLPLADPEPDVFRSDPNVTTPFAAIDPAFRAALLDKLLATLKSVEYMPVHEISLFNALREEFSEIFSSFIPALKAKDVQLYRHSLRVHSLALSFTTTILRLQEAESLKIGLAALFHDIGKMNINDTILLKVSGLSRQEYEIIKSHPAYGAELLSPFKLIKSVVPSVYHHHERLDGRGYPDGLRGDAIPLGARIIAIVDAFEVMTSHRIYQKSRTPIQAFEELYEHAGTQFDTELVGLFYKFLEKPP